VYRKRGEETVEACEESFNECTAVVGRLAVVPFELVGVTAAKALQNFGEEFNTNCSSSNVSSLSGFLECSSTIYKLNPFYWADDYVKDILESLLPLVGELPDLIVEFYVSVANMEPTGALRAVTVVAEWFDRGTDVSPIIALYAETGVAAIERGGQAAIDAINVF
jgi:hypothetical protein